jgi:hypothetical protein
VKNSKENDPSSHPNPLAVYQRAIQIMGIDNVHDAIARGGLGILQRGVPYIIVAARWQKASKYRKKSSREIPTDTTDEIVASESIWNPYEQVAKNETLRIITETLAELSKEDFIAVWDHFEGYSDEEIKKKWIELEIGPKNPKTSLIRKRRERALKQVKSILKKRLFDNK